MNLWYFYATAFAAAIAVTVTVIPLIKKLAWKLNVLDKPMSEGHKLHSDATPLLGGAGMVISFIIITACGCGLLLTMGDEYGFSEQIYGLKRTWPRLAIIIGCAIAFSGLGLWDDIKPMSAKFKLFLQTSICLIMAIWGVRITLFVDHTVASIILTVLWFTFIINAVNFYDNMDGLCTGITAIACKIFFIIAALNGQYLVASLAIAVAGTSLGFYLYNCNPASIFMGDSGSHFQGFMLATLGAAVTYITPEKNNTFTPFLVPFLILAMPVFDLFAVVVIRKKNKKPIYIGDHNHISHRFVRMGFSRRASVLMIHALAFITGISAVVIIYSSLIAQIFILIQVIAILFFLTVLHSRQNQENKS